MVTSGPGQGTPAARHPLDPLTSDEIRGAVAILRRDRGTGDRWRFAGIELAEPDKASLLGWRPGEPVIRQARITCWNTEDGRTYTAIVSLTGDEVTGFEHRPGVQANATVGEWLEADAMLRRHPQVIAALASRGITDLDLILFDTWTYGYTLIPEQYRDRRVGWVDVWRRAAPGANPYAHPINGLHPVLDFNRMELLDIGDSGPVDPPEVMGEYVPRFIPGYRARDDVRPVHITQPEGVSFQLDGNELRWQKWSLRIGFNYREGLVLHQVGYADGGRVRPVAHRMSLAEMVVPYRDTSPEHYRRTAFDIGEWGLGFMTTSLELGCDCLGEIRYLDATLHDIAGEPYDIPRAICIHEEDNGVLWKHVDPEAGAEVRRMRRLVISFSATVANYEYLVYWRFYTDGSIECEVRATGIMVVTHLAPGETAPGTIIDNRTYAPFHQHFIVARLDMDVDGTANTVYCCDSEALPVSEDNPLGLTLVQRQVPLRTEADGRQDYRWDTQRTWKIVSEGTRNRLGTPTGYKLVPGGSFPPMMDPASPVFRRAEVIGHTLWVTPYDPAERWPAGEFCNQSERDDGLAAWTAQDRPIEDTDIVLWYVFGIHHITRPEDWPVMPADTVSFWLKPVGFFDRNPALDLP
ncbi:MAG: primary-amine oxidase [Streptosporangiaceae bacterium]